jgi:serine/threonine-protein kinase
VIDPLVTGNKSFMAHVQEVLAGRYELIDVLGRGGMGVVYRSRDRRLDRIVAIKVLPVDSAEDPTAVARFEREALAAAALTHRNIVSVFDAGQDGATRFIVMECVGGRSLARLVHADGPLGVDQAVAIGAQTASALGAAHRAGIVHRDIKPANLMLDEHGTVKVLDFGIARLTAGASLTQTAMVMGSAPYLAPELTRGARADARSDVYALGCVLYELLTGRPPFISELPAAILSQHISSPPSPPERLNPAIPPALSALVLRMLAKDPDERPQDAGALATALPATLGEAAASELDTGTAATVPLAAPAGAATAPTMVMRPRFGSFAWRRRSLGALGAAVAVILALALIELTGSSGAGTGRHPATHRAASTRTATTSATTSALTSALPPPHTATPPPPPHHGPQSDAHKPRGDDHPDKPHDNPHGLPPGQAKKLGAQAQDQNQQ